MKFDEQSQFDGARSRLDGTGLAKNGRNATNEANSSEPGEPVGAEGTEE
ncbi:MAG TPA: hypothetical protein VKV17_23045 [Bryobacteraceae bacterium]|nr:hypothetical protein [Bryobacteraceae bacterium]